MQEEKTHAEHRYRSFLGPFVERLLRWQYIKADSAPNSDVMPSVPKGSTVVPFWVVVYNATPKQKTGHSQKRTILEPLGGGKVACQLERG